MPYDQLLKGLKFTQKSIGTDKGLAKIGDAIVNLSYSIAKSIHQTKSNKGKIAFRTGKKVSQKILSKALKDADMKDFAKSRASAHDMADTVEAIVAYIWLKGDLSIEEIINFLTKNLLGDLNDRNQERDAATDAFTKLLNHLKIYLPEIML